MSSPLRPLLILAGLVILTGFSVRLMVLGERYGGQAPEEGATSAPASPDGEREESRLFRALLEHGLLKPEGYLLRLPDHSLLEERHRRQFQPPDAAWEEREGLWQRLERDNGREIKAAVNRWNFAHHLVAVRDNLALAGGTGEPWQAYQRLDNGEEVPLADLSRDDFLLPLELGFINGQGIDTAFDAWNVVSPKGGDVVFRRRVQWPGGAGLTVQMIGLSPRGREGVTVTPAARRHIPRCPARGEGCVPGQAPGHLLHFDLPPGRHELRLEASPHDTRVPSVEGVPIQVRATGDHAPTWQEFSWTAPSTASTGGESHPTPVLVTRDGVVLTDGRGHATPDARSMGLWPLLGVGTRDGYTLSGLLANSPLPPGQPRVTLTIDSALQGIAQSELVAAADRWRAQGEKETVWREREERLFPHRRAAVVVLDGESGAILAAAGLPQPPPESREWDIMALGRVHFSRTPMKVHAWQGADQDYTPGSSFKPVVAVAAMGRAAADPAGELGRFLNGHPVSFFRQSPVFNRADGLFLPLDHHGAISCLDRAPAISRHDPWERPELNGDIGLAEALAYSGNAWFVHLAFLLDGQAAIDYDRSKCPPSQQRIPAPRLALAAMEEALGFQGRVAASSGVMDLAASLPVKVARHPSVGGAAGDVLNGFAGHSDLLDMDGREQAWMVTALGQNGFGHALTATPLEMARIFAALAQGRLPAPHLLHAWGDLSLVPPVGVPLALPAPWKEKLDQGLGWVVTRGTASHAFRRSPLRERVSGKTGTAKKPVQDVEQARRMGLAVGDTHHTAWFNGWYRQPSGRTLAFSCMVTQTHGPDAKSSGGAVCGPIMARILERMVGQSPAVPVAGEVVDPVIADGD